MKVKYNAPVTLTFSIVSIITLFINGLGLPLNTILALPPDPSLYNPFSYLRLISYTLAHANSVHLFSNISLILLLGPMVEEKYGMKRVIFMMFVTAISTGILNSIFFSTGIIGASGICFLFIVLSSFTNFRSREIPLTFILVMFLFLGREVMMSLKPDNVSQFAHIIGGIFGAVFGVKYGKRGK